MTELGATTLIPPADSGPQSGIVAAGAVPISFTRQVLRLTLKHLGARVGIFWIVIVGLFAVFAPFLANSHPVAMKQGGQWSSPLLHNLTPVDVVLLVGFWVALVLYYLRRIRLWTRIWTLIGVVIVSSIVAGLTVHPPAAQVYDLYRTGLKSGMIAVAHFVPIHYSPDDHQRDVDDARLKPPTRAHPMGTTADSADLAGNMIYATRIAISIGFVATGVAIALGVVMGGIMGYFGGWVDLIGMRVVEVFESVPTLLLLLAFVSKFQQSPEKALYIMMVVIGVFNSFSFAEFVRAEFLSLRNRDFVHAAQAAGLPLWSILFKHMLPNGMTSTIVNASFGVAGAILVESTLSFLGIGLQSEASWGSLLEQALGAGGSFYWWLALYPGLAIFLTVFSYNLIGESLRDALDPRLNKME
jgi:peptide/nickel transport system permease protein